MSRTNRLLKNRSQSGFTLIELLLAAALLLAASATIAVFMAQGIRLYSKLSVVGQEEDAAVCMTKMARDLRNMVFYSLIPFDGQKNAIAFASLENLSNIEGEPDPSPIRVSYRYDAKNFRIVRETVRLQTFERSEAAASETMLDGVRLLEFEYEGDPYEIPRRVTARIEYQGRFGVRSAMQDILVPSAPTPTESR